MSEPLVDVLMSVWNGEKYLEEQIESLIAQTHENWRLIIRDDRSSDASPRIIAEYCARFPGKIRLLSDGSGQLGPCQSYAKLLASASAEYAMFCDQDDVWLPRKIESCLREVIRLERENAGLPILLYTDLTVVDQSLNVVAESFWRYQRINPRNNGLNALILDNVATGCTTIFNRRLKELAEPVPKEAVMHDWWLALIGSAYGKVAYLPDRTMLYRQHGQNDTGAADHSLAACIRIILKSPAAAFRRASKSGTRARQQSERLLAHFRMQGVPTRAATRPLEEYVSAASLLARKWCLIRHGMVTGNYLKSIKKVLFC